MTSPARKTPNRTWKYLVLIVPIVAGSAGPIVATPTATASIRSVTTPGAENTASAGQALRLVNQERAKAGCVSLQVVSRLQAPAQRQSRDQAARDRMGHDGANGRMSNSRLGGLGYSQWAENVAQFQSAHAAVNFWATSSGHRANMLHCAFEETGLAVARSSSGKLYWTQTLGG